MGLALSQVHELSRDADIRMQRKRITNLDKQIAHAQSEVSRFMASLESLKRQLIDVRESLKQTKSQAVIRGIMTRKDQLVSELTTDRNLLALTDKNLQMYIKARATLLYSIRAENMTHAYNERRERLISLGSISTSGAQTAADQIGDSILDTDDVEVDDLTLVVEADHHQTTDVEAVIADITNLVEIEPSEVDVTPTVELRVQQHPVTSLAVSHPVNHDDAQTTSSVAEATKLRNAITAV